MSHAHLGTKTSIPVFNIYKLIYFIVSTSSLAFNEYNWQCQEIDCAPFWDWSHGNLEQWLNLIISKLAQWQKTSDCLSLIPLQTKVTIIWYYHHGPCIQHVLDLQVIHMICQWNPYQLRTTPPKVQYIAPLQNKAVGFELAPNSPGSFKGF